MSVVSEVVALAGRVASEFNSVRAAFVARAGANTTSLASSAVQWLRVNIPDDTSATSGWPDRLAMYFDTNQDGTAETRTGYFNEYGELRARPAKAATVALRAMGFTGGSSGDIFQVTNATQTATRFGVSESAAVFGVPLSAPNVGVKVTTGTSAPASPSVGDVWIDTN